MSAYSSQPPQQREQTFLRVKRRRNEDPPSTIRLELLGGLSVRRRDENIENSNSSHASNNNSNGMAVSSSNSFMENGHAYPATLRSSSTATLADSRHSGMSTSTSQTNNLTGNNNYNSTTRRTTTAAAVWKRVEELEGDPFATGGEKRCRVVDAVLEQDGRSTKRRKLTVLGEASVEDGRMMNSNNISGGNHNKKKNIYRVLDPLTRLVDDSLTMVHSGDRPAAQHYSFITTDPRLAVHARKWMLHRNRAGNLLHACAHWNDVELAHDLLQKALTGLADAVDEDGRTPYEIAQMSDHQSVAEVMEAFGADTTNFVYDMFVPEEIEVETIPAQPAPPVMMMTTTNTEFPQQGKMSDGDDDFNPLIKTDIHGNGQHQQHHMNGISAENPFGSVSANSGVAASALPQHPSTSAQPARPDLAMVDTSRLLELQGGVGYWTEDGELILEVEPHHMLAAEFGREGDDNEDYEDEDDIDSNCEDYGGNDYPDEDESWEEEFLHEEPLLAGDDTDDAVAGQSGSGSYGDEYGEW